MNKCKVKFDLFPNFLLTVYVLDDLVAIGRRVTATGTTFIDPDSPHVEVYLKKGIDVGTVFHELQHVIGHIGRYYGIPQTEDTEEFFAYSQQMLFRKMSSFLRRNSIC